MTQYYDDNFGHWGQCDDEDIAWYHDVQAQSVEKTCEGCGRKVRLLPHYVYCHSCAGKGGPKWELYE